jgi:hypothetical protein
MVPVSTAADFAQPESKEIALPVTQNGKTVTVRIRAVPVVKLIQALEGIPQLAKGPSDAGGTTFEQARAIVVEQDGPMRKVAALGLVDPKFSIEGDPQPGEADWNNVRFENQKFIVSQIMDFSGLSGGDAPPAPAAKEAAAQADEFRGVAAQ